MLTVILVHWLKNPLICTLPGETVQVASAGAPVQVNVTVPENPDRGATHKVYVPDAPAFRDNEEFTAVMEKSVMG